MKTNESYVLDIIRWYDGGLTSREVGIKIEKSFGVRIDANEVVHILKKLLADNLAYTSDEGDGINRWYPKDGYITSPNSDADYLRGLAGILGFKHEDRLLQIANRLSAQQ